MNWFTNKFEEKRKKDLLKKNWNLELSFLLYLSYREYVK